MFEQGDKKIEQEGQSVEEEIDFAALQAQYEAGLSQQAAPQPFLTQDDKALMADYQQDLDVRSEKLETAKEQGYEPEAHQKLSSTIQEEQAKGLLILEELKELDKVTEGAENTVDEFKAKHNLVGKDESVLHPDLDSDWQY